MPFASELVALDLETTGLDASRDAIIEIGAVRLRDGQVVDEFSALIDPGFPIPPNITHLTGIEPQDVLGAPKLAAVLPKFSDFVGNAPVIGHNISFDLAFLYPHGLLRNNPRIDTYDLASVLLPRAPRFNLNSLTALMDITLENAHRALDDARAAGLLYWKLWLKAGSLPTPTLQEIVASAIGFNWDTAAVFEAVLKDRSVSAHTLKQDDPAAIKVFGAYKETAEPLQPVDKVQRVPLDELTALIDEGGALARAMPNYEHRSQQIEMAQAVAQAFNDGQHTMIEAGTGTGKSIAYLVPSILWSTNNSERVVISTNTINLQDQLIHKDIPALSEGLGLEFRATVLKGRGNYLCPRRLAVIRRRRPTSVEELRMVAKILVWLLESTSGDKSEVSFRGPIEHATWQRLSAEDEGCTLDRCRTAMQGACPFYKARKAAEAAHLLVVNHALLVSDAMTENHVLPDYRYVVVDEAHQLEDAVTNGLSFRVDQTALQRRLADVGEPGKGLLGDVLRSAQNHLPDKEVRKLTAFVQNVSDAIGLMGVHIEALFKAAYQFLADIDAIQQSEYSLQVRIVSDHRAKNSFAQLQAVWATLDEFFEVISHAMGHLTDALKRMEQYDIPSYNDLVNSTSTAARHLDELRAQLTAFTTSPDTNTVYWLSLAQNNPSTLTFHTAPLHIGPLMEKHLWNRNEAVVMTSATLRAQDNFDYIRQRLFAEAVATVEVGSPFNYRESTLLYVPDDIPEPINRHGYQQAVERGIIELAAALNGRVLGLFTSYTQLRQTAQAITPRLTLGNITVYDQSDGSSREALLEGFKSTEKAVLLGTRSFWEGVDIPGESLSALVIVRLPFAVPTDPIFAARSETYEDSFNNYALPDAILRFRQGFGRLIRTQTDRGIVTIFDSRIITKSYGVAFLEALPDCKTQHGSLSALPEVAINWLKRP